MDERFNWKCLTQGNICIFSKTEVAIWRAGKIAFQTRSFCAVPKVEQSASLFKHDLVGDGHTVTRESFWQMI
jgi:hypothetical protein